MFTTDEGDVIRAADQAASVVEGRGKSVYSGITKVISVRLPVILAAQVQALPTRVQRLVIPRSPAFWKSAWRRCANV